MQRRMYIDDQLEKAHRAGIAHRAYDWSTRIDGEYKVVQVIAYLRGYHEGNYKKVIESLRRWREWKSGVKS